MKKMLVFDLDGTLLCRDGKITDETIEYLKNLKDKGYIIVIATGRIYASIINALNGAEFTDYLITDTGAAIYETVTANALYTDTIKKEFVEKIFDYYNDNFKWIKICNKNNVYKYSTLKDENNFVITSMDKEMILKSVEDVTHMSITMYNNDLLEELADRLIEDFPTLDIKVMQDSFDDEKWLELQPKNCSKYNAITKLASSLNVVNENIIAFGDGTNDYEMIKNCGVGVAMSNAFDEIKNVADYITKKSHNENGVIEFLKEYLD